MNTFIIKIKDRYENTTDILNKAKQKYFIQTNDIYNILFFHHRISNLFVSYKPLFSFPQDSFATEIIDIACEHHNLTSVPDWTVIKNPKVEHVHLERNRIHTLPAFGFTHLTFIRDGNAKLYLSNNPNIRLHSDAFNAIKV